ncbi:MAG: type IX secretion system sortase PorU, partial [candidate division KSB1 bacterium]|nr:type IX secretion system sortase PorU [candidate division KSB1 bacterium]
WLTTADPIPVTAFHDHIFIENEYKNLLNSGRLWLSDYFSAQSASRSYQIDLAGIVTTAPAELVLQLAGVSQGSHRFSLSWNNQPLATVPPFSGIGSKYLSIELKQFSTPIRAELQDGNNRLTINYQAEGDYSIAYLDWIELNFYRQLKQQNAPFIFCSPESSGVYQYRIQASSSEDLQLFDITDFSRVARLETRQAQAGIIEFVDSVGAIRPKKYLAVTQRQWRSPQKIEKDIPSQLRDPTNAAQFVIITYDDFYDAALALKSLRENCDSLRTKVVRISDIYDEFSWGMTDITAIRDFIKYAFDHWQVRPQYVLLLGDGDFDYKNILSSHQPNWLPPYQTAELNQLSSRPRDDWFACVAGDDDLPDLAIGRIPAQNPDQAMAVVNKIIQYENSPLRGKWLHTIALVGDDEFGEGGEYDGLHHIPDVESFAEYLIPPAYDVQKVYLTEFSAVRDAAISGIRKPAAHAALLEQINQGCLIVDFVGHGNERVWTHERILQAPEDLTRIDNGPKQAFWIAATCNFGRFDNPDLQSFAEELITTPDRGAIAVFSSARLANPFQNVALNRAVLRQIFANFPRSIRLGDVVWLAKLSTGNSANDQQYHLLGDPTLRLPMPTCSVEITSQSPDSFRALSRLELTGTIKTMILPVHDCTGEAFIEAFDSRRERKYVVRPGLEYHYQLPGNVIYRGIATVTNNSFRTRFIVPKDISYGGEDGRLRVFYSDDRMFGAGCKKQISVNGTEQRFYDNAGPTISIGFEGQHFITTGFVPPDPILLVTIADSGSGINLAGDIGHQILLTIDNITENAIVLNRYFQYEKDSYQIGHIIYPLSGLTEGDHFLRIKAWDNFNNSAQQETEFTVVALDRLVLREVMNYPNPFAGTTAFTFWANQACEVKISIFTVAGRLIRALNHLKAEPGFNHFTWDGRDEAGDELANGIYLYKIDAWCVNGSQTIRTSQIEKCAVMR